MDMCEWKIVPMLRKHSFEISKWKYEGIYAFYNSSSDTEIPSDPETPIENSYAVLDCAGALVGHFHFGIGARIPTAENYHYSPDRLDVGLGMRPDLCGCGNGTAFVEKGLHYAESILGVSKFRLSVAAFNERAIKVYEKAGFVKLSEVTNSYFHNKFYIMLKG